MQLHKVMAPVRSMRRVMQNDLLLLRLLKAVLKDQWRYTHITTFTKSPQLEFYFIIFPMPFWTCRWIMPYYYFFFLLFMVFLFLSLSSSRDDKQIIKMKCMACGFFLNLRFKTVFKFVFVVCCKICRLR